MNSSPHRELLSSLRLITEPASAASDRSSMQNPACSESDSTSPCLPLGWGSLHGKACTLEQYVDLAVSELGRYDLVDGTLEAREMADGNHDSLAEAYKRAYDQEARPNQRAYENIAVEIASSMASPSVQRRKFRVADVSVGRMPSGSSRQRLSSGPHQGIWDLDHPPKVVIEITSYNAETDLKDKAKDYARAGVKNYLIIDRDKKNAGTEQHDPKVHYGRREGQGYRFETHNQHSQEPVGSPGPLHLPTPTLLDPEKMQEVLEGRRQQKEFQYQQEQSKRRESEARERRERDERKKAEERERRERDERKKAEEQERRERDERKKAEEREKRERDERKKAEERERRERDERKKAEKEREKAEERERRERDERKKAEERERRERDERKKVEKKRRHDREKKRRLKNRLRALGEPVSDSSSDDKSPVRKNLRR